MSSIQHFVSPKLPTVLTNDTYIDLPGYDVWLIHVNSVHVVPTELDVVEFEEALSRVLQLYPHTAGQLRCTDGRWSIELSNAPIPVDIDHKIDVSSGSVLNSDWVIQDDLSSFISQQPIGASLINGNAPLLRVKLTFFNGETYIGISWNHSLGDGTTMLRFMHTLSQFYQGLPPEFAAPTFKKYDFPTPSHSVVTRMSSRMALHPMPQFDEAIDAESRKDLEHMRWRIESHDLDLLRTALCTDSQDKKSLSKQDCLTAYVVALLNQNQAHPVQSVLNVCSYRHIGALFVTENAASNLLLVVTAKVPTDIAGVAAAVRDALKQSREPTSVYVLQWLQSRVMLDAANARRPLPFLWDHSNELFINSHTAIDWCRAHFGYPDGVRFHTDVVNKQYMRTFRSNPTKGDDGVWRARQSIDISIGVSAEVKRKMLESLAWGVHYVLENHHV